MDLPTFLLLKYYLADIVTNPPSEKPVASFHEELFHFDGASFF